MRNVKLVDKMDIEHFYIEKGQGDTLILLHGNGENCDYFAGQVDEFARFYHVYALDTRGHGKTPRGTAPNRVVRIHCLGAVREVESPSIR